MTEMRTLKWEPDTCGCVFGMVHDPALPEDLRLVIPAVSKVRCEHHRKAADVFEQFAAVIEENQRRNAAVCAVLEAGGEVRTEGFTESRDFVLHATVDVPLPSRCALVLVPE